MKGTFDDDRIQFFCDFIIIMERVQSPKIKFEELYGLGIENYLTLNKYDHFALSSKRNNTHEEYDFGIITFQYKHLTFEDVIESYLTNPINYQNFSDVGKIHALSFLERYCMNYEDVKDVKKKYVKTL